MEKDKLARVGAKREFVIIPDKTMKGSVTTHPPAPSIKADSTDDS